MSVKSIASHIVNVPGVWIAFQYLVGANQWKSAIYPSVFRSKGRLLDFGCAMGNLTGDFLAFEYWGIDLDATMIDAAKKRWAATPNVHFECADILQWGDKQGYFDHVLFAATGHHLSDAQMPRIIDALLGKLRASGEIHFFDPLSQPGKDRFITRLIKTNDQGKHMRTRSQYDAIFAPYNVTEKKLLPSPDRLIKLQDMLYVRIAK